MVDNFNNFINNNNNTDNKNNNNKNTTKNSLKNKDLIIKWYFNFNIEERFKIISITNLNFCEMIKKMYLKYLTNQKSKFRLKFIKDLIDFHEIDSFEIKYNNVPPSNEQKICEKLFLKSLKFFTLRDELDTISISNDLLNNEQLFLYYFNFFSNNNFLSSNFKITYEQKLKLYKSGYPNWFDINNFYSICEIISAHFEVMLNLKFYLYSNKNFLKNIKEENKLIS